MLCPKCQNVISLSEYSCSRCGFRLPVKDQRERIIAEQFAEQYYKSGSRFV